MEGLAERAGVSKGLGYNYFDDVHDVVSALWDREVAEVYRRIEEETLESATEDFEARMGRAIEVYLELVSERGTLLGALERTLSRAGARSGARRRVRAFVSFWADQIESALSLPRPRAEVLAAMILSAVDASVRTWQAKRITRADAAQLSLAFLFDGIRGVQELERKARRRRGSRREQARS